MRWNSLFSAISRFLNCRERITMFCRTYKPGDKAKALTKDDLFQPKHWLQLEHLHDHLETFEELSSTKQKFLELSAQSLQKRKKADAQAYQYLAGCSEAAWEKGN